MQRVISLVCCHLFDISGTRDGAHEGLTEKFRFGYPLGPDELIPMLGYAGRNQVMMWKFSEAIFSHVFVSWKQNDSMCNRICTTYYIKFLCYTKSMNVALCFYFYNYTG